MKTFIFSLIVIISGTVVFGQVPNRPESIIWDADHDRYLISNHGNGTNGSIIAYDPVSDTYSWFNQTETTGPKGLAIYNNVLYVSDDGCVNGFNLDSGQRVFHKQIGNNMINDLVVDAEGILYLGHRDASKVYKINTQNGELTEWISSSDIYEVNGLYLDSENNRIIACFTRDDSPIMAFDLETGNHTVLMETSHSVLDGIARDHCGYYYISCHGSQSILKFDPDFENPPTKVLEGYNGPADIFYNPCTQQLCIPEIEGSNIILEEIFQPCLAPEPVNPADGDEEAACRSLCMTWNPVLRADYYRLEVATDMEFRHMAVIDGTPDTSYMVESLETGTEYFWRVSAYWNNQHTDYSPVWSFTTESSSSALYQDKKTIFRIYPNPAGEFINIECPDNPPEKINIYTLGGQLVLSRELHESQQTVRLPLNISPGKYFLSLQGRDFCESRSFVLK